MLISRSSKVRGAMFTCRWRRWWCASTSDYLTKDNQLIYTNFVLTDRQQSLPSILVQTTWFYGEWFKIYHVQNFVWFFCGIYYVTTVTINGINRMHMLSVLLTALFRIFRKLHFRLFCSTIKYVYKTLHFLVKQLHNTTSAVNNYHSSFHHNYHTKTGILHWLWIQEGSSTSYVSLHSSVNVVWHHSTCPTNFKQVARMEPRQRLRSSSSPALVVPATRRSSLGNQTFLVAAARAWNSHCCINPAFIPSSPENSSVHRIFSTTLVTLSAFWANVTCFWLC